MRKTERYTKSFSLKKILKVLQITVLLFTAVFASLSVGGSQRVNTAPQYGCDAGSLSGSNCIISNRYQDPVLGCRPSDSNGQKPNGGTLVGGNCVSTISGQNGSLTPSPNLIHVNPSNSQNDCFAGGSYDGNSGFCTRPITNENDNEKRVGTCGNIRMDRLNVTKYNNLGGYVCMLNNKQYYTTIRPQGSYPAIHVATAPGACPNSGTPISNTECAYPAKVTSHTPEGFLEYVSESGIATGWALDKDILPASITIHFYVNDTKIGETQTSQLRQDVNDSYNTTGNHGYEFKIPASYCDNKSHQLKAFAIDPQNVDNILLINSPTTIQLAADKCNPPKTQAITDSSNINTAIESKPQASQETQPTTTPVQNNEESAGTQEPEITIENIELEEKLDGTDLETKTELKEDLDIINKTISENSSGNQIKILSEVDISQLVVTCNRNQLIYTNSKTICSFNLNQNRILPKSLKIGIGDSSPAGSCTLDATGSKVVCSNTPTGSDNGEQKVYLQIAEKDKTATNSLVKVNSLQVVRSGGSLATGIAIITLVCLGICLLYFYSKKRLVKVHV